MGRVELNESLNSLLKDAKLEMGEFNRKSYEERFNAFCNKHASTLGELEKYYYAENESLEMLEELAASFSEYAHSELELLKKRKRELAMVDYNLAMVSFVFPMFSNRRTTFMDVFADKCVLAWNEKFPKTKIEKSTQEAIQGGFKSKMCYITTAVCENMNLPDDCYELTTLRAYRDGYLLNETEDGAEVVKAYYNMAPTIVKRINREVNSHEIYEEIWSGYLEPCIRCIEADDLEETKVLYSAMVRELAEQYMF